MTMITLYKSLERLTSKEKESTFKNVKTRHIPNPSADFVIPPVEVLAFPNHDVAPHDPTGQTCPHPKPFSDDFSRKIPIGWLVAGKLTMSG